MMKRFGAALLLAFLPSLAIAQGVPIKSGADSNLVTVDANKNMRVSDGPSARPTYLVSMGAQATTAAMTLSIEAPAATGFKLAFFCVSSSIATAAAKVDVVLQRRTSASSGGVACTNEFTTVGGTGCSIAKNDPADGSYGGVGRNAGTPGTAGAVLGQWGFTTPELGAGAADPAGPPPFCVDFGTRGGKMPTVAAGASNGLTITVSAAGAGGLAAGAITANIIVE
jgi:hypothetical protein